MISEFLSALILGGILGMVGQGMRVIVGMKKLYETLEDNEAFGNKLDWGRLWVSLVIGFIAGAFGMILKIDYQAVSTMVMSKDFMISIIAIGYMGVDFIEGMMKTFASRFNSMPAPTAQPQFQQNKTTVQADQINVTIDNSKDASFGTNTTTVDLPATDVPANPTENFNIPNDIPKSY